MAVRPAGSNNLPNAQQSERPWSSAKQPGSPVALRFDSALLAQLSPELWLALQMALGVFESGLFPAPCA